MRQHAPMPAAETAVMRWARFFPRTQIENPGKLEPRGAEHGDPGGGEHLQHRMRNVQNVHRRRKEERVERERGECEDDHEDGVEERRRRVAEILLHARPGRFRLRTLAAHLLFLRFEFAERAQAVPRVPLRFPAPSSPRSPASRARGRCHERRDRRRGIRGDTISRMNVPDAMRSLS